MLIAGNMVLFNKKATLSTRYKLKVLDHFQDFFPFIYLFFPSIILFYFIFNFYFYFILLYNTVLVLPYIDMNPPWVYM